ncbi:MAG TPA: helix-turn-helix domain-containing protein [Gemmatimonadaceae bacterium]|nr:helix-turn-helix domain-containing protein [Gemmatimonadaceae bacterium]
MVENVLGCKWSLKLLQLVGDGVHRPSALLRATPGLSAKVMNERLRKMLRYGILDREVKGDKPPIEVEYRLTPFGERFLEIVRAVERLDCEVRAGEIPWEPSKESSPGASPRPVAGAG